MKLHILGIGGTFMGSLAALAKELNFSITGSDTAIYPPMSTQLEMLGIKLYEGYDSTEPLANNPECFVVGNVMRRGMPILETILNENRSFLSGPEWLAKYVLKNRHVLAVSGTHGKTTTSSMLACILEEAGLNPGFLIGGVPGNFSVSARLGTGPFVIEADEYDTAFFDKRSKFLHYRPRTLIINNIEFDHADIFPDLAAIQTQFHHLIRTLPSQGLIIRPESDLAIQEVMAMGCWTPQTTLGFSEKASWWVKNANEACDKFEVWSETTKLGTVEWTLLGKHNIANALAAIAAAYHVGVKPEAAISALCRFRGVKRRLEIKGSVNGITVYDDFAHHPTAIKTTLQGLRAKLGYQSKIIAVVDLRSNTMRAGHHQHALTTAFEAADVVYFYRAEAVAWDVEQSWKLTKKLGGVYSDLQQLLNALKATTKTNDHVLFMSNGGFSNCQMQFLQSLPHSTLSPCEERE